MHKVIHRLCGRAGKLGAACPRVRAYNAGRNASVKGISSVWSVIQASGWPIWPLLLASILAVAIIIERAWTLRRKRINPPGLLDSVLEELRRGASPLELAQRLEGHSPLGRVWRRGCATTVPRASDERSDRGCRPGGGARARTLSHGAGDHRGHLAAAGPARHHRGDDRDLRVAVGGRRNPQQLAHGISVALNTTGLGLIIAIPATIFWRHFRAYVDSLVIEMEQEAVRLVEVAHGERARNAS